jgi:hypothetical protein
VVIDPVIDPMLKMSSKYLQLYPNHQVVLNHSLYHLDVPLAMKVLSRNPRGITMVLDGDTPEIKVEKDDYEFVAKRMTEYPMIEAYRVSGNIFLRRSRAKKGRIFNNEIWYTRRQWSKWGFMLFSDPSEPSQFVRDHVVLFDGVFRPMAGIKARHPAPVLLSLGSPQSKITSKPPIMHQLFQSESVRHKELACYLGMPVYQTPKIDGIYMRLVVSTNKEVHLVDRMGLQYRVVSDSVTLLAKRVVSFVLGVELIPQAACKSYLIYANQLIGTDPSISSTDSLDELVRHVTLFNSLLDYEVVGLKDYKLTRNSVAQLDTTLPYDGVVYVPAYIRASDPRPQIHSFVKPFAGTETIYKVMTTAAQRKTAFNSPFEIFYRAQAINSDGTYTIPIQKNTIFKDSIVKIARDIVNDKSDLFGPSTVSPLLFEGYYIPSSLAGTQQDAFVITHVRGDKVRKDVDVKVTKNLDWINTGVLGLTRWGSDGKDVLMNFFLHLSSSRVMKLLPSNVGVQASFLSKFMNIWSENLENSEFSCLNENIVAGLWVGSVDTLIKALRQKVPYYVALSMLDVLLSYPFVHREVIIESNKLVTLIRFRPTDKYKSLLLEDLTDPLEEEK